MLGRVPHQGGLPGQPVRVIRFSWVSFLQVKATEWGNLPYRGNQVFEHGKLFRRFHLQNRQNADEIDNACNNLGVESDSQANQRNQT